MRLSGTDTCIRDKLIGILEDATGEIWMRVKNGLSGRRGRPSHEKTAQRWESLFNRLIS